MMHKRLILVWLCMSTHGGALMALEVKTEVVVEPGGSLVLECDVSNSSSQVFICKFDKTKFTEPIITVNGSLPHPHKTYENRTQFNQTLNEIVILNFTEKDVGTYTCCIVNYNEIPQCTQVMAGLKNTTATPVPDQTPTTSVSNTTTPVPDQTTTTGVSNTTTPVPDQTTTTGVSNTTTPVPDQTTTTKIITSVCVTVGVAVIVLIIGFILWKRKKRNSRSSDETSHHPPPPPAGEQEHLNPPQDGEEQTGDGPAAEERLLQDSSQNHQTDTHCVILMPDGASYSNHKSDVRPILIHDSGLEEDEHQGRPKQCSSQAQIQEGFHEEGHSA